MIQKLKDKFGQTVNVEVNHTQEGIKFLTGVEKVIFGKIDGKGKEYAFKIPTKYVEVLQ